MTGEEEATFYLQHLGFRVESIPTTATQTADLVAKMGNSRAIIEVKDRFDSSEELEKKQRLLKEQGFFAHSRQLVTSNRLSGIAKKGVSQIDCVAHGQEDYRILWFNLRTTNSEAELRVLRNTMYGIVQIMGLSDPLIRPCYFFNDSIFYSSREKLDAVVSVVYCGEQAQLKIHLNPLSPRFSSLLKSATVAAFGEAVEDPIEAERSGAYLLESEADRSSEVSKLQSLSAKYAAGPLQTFTFNHLTAEVRVQRR